MVSKVNKRKVGHLRLSNQAMSFICDVTTILKLLMNTQCFTNKYSCDITVCS